MTYLRWGDLSERVTSPALSSVAFFGTKCRSLLLDSLHTGLSPSAAASANPAAVRMSIDISRGCHWASPAPGHLGSSPSTPLPAQSLTCPTYISSCARSSRACCNCCLPSPGVSEGLENWMVKNEVRSGGPRLFHAVPPQKGLS